MPYTVVFLWISASAAQSPAEGRLADLADFGAARNLSFAPLVGSDGRDKSVGSAAYDGARVDRLENILEQARTLLSALEEETASTLLGQAEVELLAHPDLPQAAFLMAECFALKAQAARALDPGRAAELEASRAALEGRRASAFGDSFTAGGEPAMQVLRVAGLSPIDELELDGGAVSARTRVELAPGLHHARVWRAGRPIFAKFFPVRADQSELRLQAPRLTPCDRDDLAALDAKAVAGGAAVPAGIACHSWALVREEGAGIGVAQCSGSHCGAFVHWQRRRAEPFTPAVVDRQSLPTWATFAIVGAATVAATSVVLWQAGAFDSGNPNAASFRYAGVNPQGIRF